MSNRRVKENRTLWYRIVNKGKLDATGYEGKLTTIIEDSVLRKKRKGRKKLVSLKG